MERCESCGSWTEDCECPIPPWKMHGFEEEDMDWSVEVYRDGESLVTLSNRDLSGRELSESDQDLIRLCAQHLLSFVGPKKCKVCECEGFGTTGPYPSGICPECGEWYPGKSKAS